MGSTYQIEIVFLQKFVDHLIVWMHKKEEKKLIVATHKCGEYDSGLFTSAPNVKLTPRSFSPHPIVSLSGSDQSKSHSKPWSGTSVGRIMRRICSMEARSGLRPPWHVKIFSSTIHTHTHRHNTSHPTRTFKTKRNATKNRNQYRKKRKYWLIRTTLFLCRSLPFFSHILTHRTVLAVAVVATHNKPKPIFIHRIFIFYSYLPIAATGKQLKQSVNVFHSLIV